ncbi:hypothetical protein KFU94_34870 [Chloroflexi bacterium TSY]|nr:hypothetical protein [Chloroflexi bacterium TSY]
MFTLHSNHNQSKTRNSVRFYTLSFLLLAAVVLSACTINLVEPVASGPAVISKANIHVFGDNTNDIAGASSVLARTADGVTVSIDTVDLTPGEAYSIWWIVFNNPAACEGATCKGSELSNPETVGMVGYATGGIADENGVAHFGAHLAVGDNSIALDNASGFPYELMDPAPGLIDPMSAEIHTVIRTHGAALPDPTLQITTFNGDCNPECKNMQAALHLPRLVAAR